VKHAGCTALKLWRWPRRGGRERCGCTAGAPELPVPGILWGV